MRRSTASNVYRPSKFCWYKHHSFEWWSHFRYCKNTHWFYKCFQMVADNLGLQQWTIAELEEASTLSDFRKAAFLFIIVEDKCSISLVPFYIYHPKHNMNFIKILNVTTPSWYNMAWTCLETLSRKWSCVYFISHRICLIPIGVLNCLGRNQCDIQ